MIKLDADVQSLISRLVSDGAADAVLPQLSAFTRVVAGSTLLSRALAEADSSVEATRKLIADLTRGQLSDNTMDVAAAVASSTTDSRKLPAALADACATVAFVAAEAAGELEKVETGLYDFAAAVRSNADLRETLTNPNISDKAKEDFLVDLLGTKVDDRVVELLRTVVVLDYGRDTDVAAQALSDAAAARRQKVVALVRSAVELDDDRRNRLIAALEQSVGKPVEGRFSVDPAVVGSVIVRIGDEVFDGSVRHRLEQAKIALSSAS